MTVDPCSSNLSWITLWSLASCKYSFMFLVLWASIFSTHLFNKSLYWIPFSWGLSSMYFAINLMISRWFLVIDLKMNMRPSSWLSFLAEKRVGYHSSSSLIGWKVSALIQTKLNISSWWSVKRTPLLQLSMETISFIASIVASSASIS